MKFKKKIHKINKMFVKHNQKKFKSENLMKIIKLQIQTEWKQIRTEWKQMSNEMTEHAQSEWQCISVQDSLFTQLSDAR